MNRQEAQIKLRSIFGIDHFYDEQWTAIDKLLKGERILMIQRTGFGKSLCYQFPATQFSGITVVFSPLIALMRDQVKSLDRLGIPAGYINSEQTPEDNHATIEKALAGKIKILYIAPERQENTEWIDAARRMNLSMIVIDEAHTISTWGHDFRPAFRRIIDLVKLLPTHLPVLATTATATKKVQKDIETQIGGRLSTIRGSLARENFNLYVIRVSSEDEKMMWIADNIDKLPGTGLIYTGTRIDVETYAKWLQYMKINAIDYHAGFDAATRKDIENGLMENRWKCIVSTNALGMGVDKPDIRFIIHTQIPASPIHYYQEIGRAGRDGKPTYIILFYNDRKTSEDIPVDYQLPRSFIESARPAAKKYEEVISLLKHEPLSEREIIKKANLKTTQVRIIKADLIDQGIIKEVKYDTTKKYEIQYNAPSLDTTKFEELRESKLRDLKCMVDYIYTSEPRMKYLCSFLDSDENHTFSNCDNTTLSKLRVNRNATTEMQLEEFRSTFFPELETADSTSKNISNANGVTEKLGIRVSRPGIITVLRDGMPVGSYKGSIQYSDFRADEIDTLQTLWHQHCEKKSRLTDGVAASLYGVSSVGAAIHRSKYENGGDFPDFLLKLALKAFRKNFGNTPFDIVVYVPPTHSGDLVKNFAQKFASVIKVPISHDLVKTRETCEQKIFQNSYSKKENVAGAFDFVSYQKIKGARILLIDDIYDSGATIKEIGAVLTRLGAAYIVPIVIAKTVGGTL
jgi:ATP-dependent DNA helicase RecQ